MNHVTCNRFPSGPAYDQGGEPQFNCSAQDCDYAAFVEDELKQCEVCLKRHCKDCIVTLRGIPFCKACAVCDRCKAPATALCLECGDLVCAEDSLERANGRLCLMCSGPKEALCVCCANGQHGSHLIGAKCDCMCHPSNQRKAKRPERKPAVSIAEKAPIKEHSQG